MQPLNNGSLYCQKLHEFYEERSKLTFRYRGAKQHATWALYNKHLYPKLDSKFFLDLMKKLHAADIEYNVSIDFINRKIGYAMECIYNEIALKAISLDKNIIQSQGIKRKNEEALASKVEKKQRL